MFKKLAKMTTEIRNYTVNYTVKTPTLPLSSELPAQAESAKRAVANGAS